MHLFSFYLSCYKSLKLFKRQYWRFLIIWIFSLVACWLPLVFVSQYDDTIHAYISAFIFFTSLLSRPSAKIEDDNKPVKVGLFFILDFYKSAEWMGTREETLLIFVEWCRDLDLFVICEKKNLGDRNKDTVIPM